MIELKLKLSDGKGQGRTISDYLLAETPEKLAMLPMPAG